MIAMAKTPSMDSPWLEILPPPEPTIDIWMSLLIIAILVVTLIILYRYWQNRPRQRALKGLKQLQQQFEQNKLDNKLCLFEINRLLCLGLEQTGLTQFTPPSKQDNWQQFYQTLRTQQYRADIPDRQHTQKLLHTACQLLKDIRP